MKCSQCPQEFEQKRPWQKWCSTACKSAHHRAEYDRRICEEWQNDNRFSLPGDGGKIKSIVSAERRRLERTETTLTPDIIQRAVAELFQVPLKAMLSASREPHLSTPRFVAMYLVRTELHLSQPESGRAFSRHHTTVLHAEREIALRMPLDAKLAARVHTLQRLLRAAATRPACCSECGRAISVISPVSAVG